MLRWLVLVLCATAVTANAPVYPVAGCWEMVAGHRGFCRQWWGYQTESEVELTIGAGINNYMLFAGRKASGLHPITSFSRQHSGRAAFSTESPCDNSLIWHLQNHTAHARVGHSTHHCSGDLGAKSIEAYFPPVAIGHCDQLSLHAGANGGCQRMDHMVRGALAHTQALDVSLETFPRDCTPHTTVPVTLAWTLRRACDAAADVRETFATIEVECDTAHLHFGIDGRSAVQWTPGLTSGVAVRPAHGSDQGSRALVRALDRLDEANEADLVFLGIVAHGEGLETRVTGAVVRMCYDKEQQRSEASALFTAQESGRLSAFAECTSVLDEHHGGSADGDICRSWFGYALDGTGGRLEHRPVSARNTFVNTPYDRGQPVYFRPGEHRYAFSVVWNCSDYAELTGPSITWALDSAATATRRGPMCHVGCDGVQGSNKQYDRCGVCGGTGQTCAHGPRAVAGHRSCDGDNERRVHTVFADVPPGMTVAGDHDVTTFSTAQPPRPGLGAPNADFGGPGKGPGGARTAPGANSVPLPGALAFRDGGKPGCMRVELGRPVHLHSMTVLDTTPFCTSKVSQPCTVSTECLGVNEACVGGECVPGGIDDDGLSAEQQAMLTNYMARGYYGGDDWQRCHSNYDCDDGQACTVDVCICERCLHRLNKWCCDDDAQCPLSLDPCEEAFCDPDINRCDRRPVADPQCCSAAHPCAASGSLCTETLCVDNQCRNITVDGCCESRADCTAGAQADCVDNQCIYSSERCETVDDCARDGDGPCVQHACQDNACVTTAIPGCCVDDASCAEQVLFPCVEAVCVDGACQVSAIEGCCRADDWCDDANECTVDTCAEDNTCQHVPVDGCCRCAGECDDGDSCTRDLCTDNACVNEPIELCCTNTTQCPESQFPCAEYVCDADIQRCVLEPTGHFCCTTEQQCEVVGSPCIQGFCDLGENQCRFEAALGCCTNNTDCGVPSNPCLVGVCSGNGTCEVTQLDCDDQDPCTDDVCSAGQCMNVPKQCADDNNPCTADVCIEGVCTHVINETAAGCCLPEDLAQCEDRGVCFDTTCVLGNCVYAPVAGGCCENVTDCNSIIETVPNCTLRACTNNQCVVVPDATCCFADAECPQPDPSTCEVALCVDGACVAAPDPECCSNISDCREFPANTCLDLVDCVAGRCEYESRIPCCDNATQCEYLLGQIESLDNASCYDAQCNATSGLCELVDLCPPCDYCNTTSDCHPQSLCTVAACVNDTCVYSELDCNDNISCTIDACAGGICVHDDTPCTPVTSSSSTGFATSSSTGFAASSSTGVATSSSTGFATSSSTGVATSSGTGFATSSSTGFNLTTSSGTGFAASSSSSTGFSTSTVSRAMRRVTRVCSCDSLICSRPLSSLPPDRTQHV